MAQIKIIEHLGAKVIGQQTVSSSVSNPIVIQAQKGVKYELKDMTTNTAPIKVMVKKVGKNLEVNLDGDHNGAPDLILENFFDISNTDMIGIDKTGTYYSYVAQSDGNIVSLNQIASGQEDLSMLGVPGEKDDMPIWAYLAGAGALIGIAAAAGGGGGGGGEDGTTVGGVDDAGSVTIEGSAVVGQTLTTDLVDPDGITGTPVYTWSVDGAAVANPNADQSTFTLTADHEGKPVSVSVTYSDPFGSHTVTDALDVGNNGGTTVGADTTPPPTAASIEIVLDTNNDGSIDGAEKGGAATTDVAVGIPADAQIGDVITVTNNLTGSVIATYIVDGTTMTAGSTQTISGVALPTGVQVLTVTSAIRDASGNVGPSSSDSAIVNQAPIVNANNSTLLGLVGVEALGLLDISNQAVFAMDANSNIKTVTVKYTSLVKLSTYQLTASSVLAAELGLTVSVVNNPGILGLLAASSTITITATDGGPIDNMKLNEFLTTIHFENTVLNVGVLDTLSITATDMNGLSSTDSSSDLLNVGLLHTQSDDSGIQEGTSGNDGLNGTASSDCLYGFAGGDTLSGAEGNDLLRGGDGNDLLNGGDGNDILIGGDGIDVLHGDAGNDILVFDAMDSIIDGGTGIDTLLIQGSNITLDLSGVAGTQIVGIEKIDITGDGDNALAINYTDLLALSDTSDTLYITGNGGDTVTLSAETFTGSATVDGVIYNTYDMGGTAGADIWIQQDIRVL